MTEKKSLIIFFGLILVVLVSGCIGEKDSSLATDISVEEIFPDISELSRGFESPLEPYKNSPIFPYGAGIEVQDSYGRIFANENSWHFMIIDIYKIAQVTNEVMNESLQTLVNELKLEYQYKIKHDESVVGLGDYLFATSVQGELSISKLCSMGLYLIDDFSLLTQTDSRENSKIETCVRDNYFADPTIQYIVFTKKDFLVMVIYIQPKAVSFKDTRAVEYARLIESKIQRNRWWKLQ
jgi:hypothetical protein